MFFYSLMVITVTLLVSAFCLTSWILYVVTRFVDFAARMYQFILPEDDSLGIEIHMLKWH